MIPLAKINVQGLLRTPRAGRVAAIAAAIKEDGQDRPLEISPVGEGFRLTKGLVRFAALSSLGAEAAWCEIRRVANSAERRQREIDDNLLGDGCTVLDRARYLAAARDAYHARHPETAQGAWNRISPPDLAGLPSFGEYAAQRYGQSARSIERACAIGARIDKVAAALLAETDWADHQAALEGLSRHEPAVQQAAAKALVRFPSPSPSVNDALAEVLGAAAIPDTGKKAWSAALGGWGRMGAKDRREWLRTIAVDLPTGVRLVFDGDAE